jgi:hypothetical protein
MGLCCIERSGRCGGDHREVLLVTALTALTVERKGISVTSYAKGMEYELLVKSIYEAISVQKDVANSKIERNVVINGAAGVGHQIDILWSFDTNDQSRRVLIECKNYSKAVDLGVARNFKGVLDDIGNCDGLIVTKVGFQKGAQKFCEHYNILTKVCRKPTDKDWRGRIRTIRVEFAAKILASNPEKPVVVKFLFEAETLQDQQQIQQDIDTGKISLPNIPDMCLYDAEGNQITDEISYLLPRYLDYLKKPDGGPYTEGIRTPNYYVYVFSESGDSILKKIGAIEVTYFVETIELGEFVVAGEDVVEAILKDTVTNELDFTKRIISLP